MSKINPLDEIEALLVKLDSLSKHTEEYDTFLIENWDTLAAAHYWCFDHHSGGGSREYALGCRIHYNPGGMEKGPDEEQKMIYDHWCLVNECTHD